MVSAARQRELAVWANGERVGTWTVDAGTHVLAYDPGWIAAPHGRPLSHSLPFGTGNAAHRGAAVRDYFENLLPDNDTIRQRVQRQFGTPDTSAFSLLRAVGRDCVGAIQLLPPGEAPPDVKRIEARPLTDAQVAQAIEAMLDGGFENAADVVGPFRISIAGAQEKTALLRHEGRWCAPLGGTPTTHILKLPLGLVGNLRYDMSASVENEWLCATILRACGLPVATAEIATFGRHRVLAVERFDRALQHHAVPWLARLPQEDFCQALGLSPARKYESDGGPGIDAIFRLLDLSTRADADKLTFLKSQLLFWMLAAVDGHAKNFSLAIEPGGRFHLTPLYDVLSAWPIVGNGAHMIHFRRLRLAMAVRGQNAHYHVHQVQARHWDALARRYVGAGAFDELIVLALGMPHALEQVESALPEAFPRRVFDTIRNGTLRMAKVFLDGV
ncbi:type II toxin-antitoxin system HipA family toxin [Ramlibacter sp.]|uniref:type II toxin-antitoxin system HipA family toxin n=1 Tax=Ramlibacter sp. TaxID=1917967 RepID=UPI003D0D3280